MTTLETALKGAMANNRRFCPRSVDLVDHALFCAEVAHSGQYRKYTDEDYIMHPITVAEIVMNVFPDVDMVCAAYLHDTVEDCNVTLADLEGAGFGPQVVRLVENLTDVSRPEDGNRARRKAIDLAHTAQASDAAKLIKLADLLHNTCSIAKHDLNFAKVYLKEKVLLLEVLQPSPYRIMQSEFAAAHRFLWELTSLQVCMNWEKVYGN